METQGAAVNESHLEFGRWPRYRAAKLGFWEHWYPVIEARRIGRKPKAVKVLGQEICLVRSNGAVRALHDRCPHRGIPLSLGKKVFDGTLSCIYHGWTFDTSTGVLVAALTDGADSPICGKASVKTYPVREEKGLVWVYLGDRDPPPLQADVPSEFLADDAAVMPRITVRPGNWRYAAENGFDEAHAKFLHRNAPWMVFRYFPAWMRVRIEPEDEGWITRIPTEVGFKTHYPGVGSWPPRHPWRTKTGRARVSIRLPGVLRVAMKGWTHYEWYVPVDETHHLYLQFMHVRGGRFRRAVSRARYWTYIRWLFHIQFNNQDLAMVELMPGRSYPERLFRPDVSITAWRKLCEGDTGIEIDSAVQSEVAAG